MISAALERESTTDSWTEELNGIVLHAGAGAARELGELARRTGGRRALLVTDPGLEAAGHAPRARAALENAGVVASLFTGVHQNPSASEVARGADAARELGADLLVALGGGSALDCAKGINFLLSNGGTIADYWGYGKASKPMLPMIAVPTTCGTGSEAQTYALISDDRTHRKMACGDPKAKFAQVVLDPELLPTAPFEVRANAGLDAISHAVEARVTARRNQSSDALAERAFALLDGAIESVLERSTADSSERQAAFGRMQWGAHLAGAAIEQSMLGAAHAAANPLTARFGIVHGEAVNLMLPHVVRFNAEGAREQYERLVAAGPEALAGRIETLRARAELAERLQDREVPREAIPDLARMATREWTGHHNPRPLTAEDFAGLYELAY